MKKKVISILLALLMTLSVLPVSALAENSVDPAFFQEIESPSENGTYEDSAWDEQPELPNNGALTEVEGAAPALSPDSNIEVMVYPDANGGTPSGYLDEYMTESFSGDEDEFAELFDTDYNEEIEQYPIEPGSSELEFPTEDQETPEPSADGDYSNGDDVFTAGGCEYYSDPVDEAKLYLWNLETGEEQKLLDVHVASLFGWSGALYLLSCEEDQSALLQYNFSDNSYEVLKNINGLTTNAVRRDSVLYYILNGQVLSYNLETGEENILLDAPMISTLYFSDYNTLKYYITDDAGESVRYSYDFRTGSTEAEEAQLMASYSPRLTAPAKNNPYYTTWNVFHTSGYGMAPNIGNCTCYAYGRSYENLGSKPKLCTGNAGTWYAYNRNNGYYRFGSTPYLGAVAVWSKAGGAGHVAVVEAIDGNTVTTSESGWRSFYFTTRQRKINSARFGASSGYTFLGFIYVMGTSGGGGTPTPNPGCALYQVNTSAGLKMRSGPGTNYGQIGSVPNSAYLQVSKIATGSGYTWGYTSYGGRTGWVALNYCQHRGGSIASGPNAYNINYYTSLKAGQPQSLKIDYNGATSATMYVCDNNYKEIVHWEFSSNNTYVRITGLSAGTTYRIYMITRNSSGSYNGKDRGNVAVFSVSSATQYLQNGMYTLLPQCALDKALTTNGAGNQTKIYSFSGASTQHFNFNYLGGGLYRISSASDGRYLDVSNSGTDNGTPVLSWNGQGGSNQQWYLLYAGDGYYYIGSACNMLYLDVNGASNRNNTKVQMWEGNSSSAQKWKIQPAGTWTVSSGTCSLSPKCATSKALYISGGSYSSGANACIYTYSNTTSKQFRLVYAGKGYYYIVNRRSGKYLDVSGGGYSSGTNVWQYTRNETDAQKWVIRSAGGGYYYIISKLNGLYLDVNNASNTNNANVQVYTGNSSSAQKWKITWR